MLKLDADGDVDMARGLQFVGDVEAVLAGARFRLGLIRGEWFANRDVGVPYFPRDEIDAGVEILGQPFEEAKIRRYISEALLSTPNLTTLLGLTVSYDNATRTCTVEWEARASWGDTITDTQELI
jgi:hypothetical protein